MHKIATIFALVIAAALIATIAAVLIVGCSDKIIAECRQTINGKETYIVCEGHEYCTLDEHGILNGDRCAEQGSGEPRWPRRI